MIIQNFIFEILKEYIIKKNHSPSETLTTKLAPTNVWLTGAIWVCKCQIGSVLFQYQLWCFDVFSPRINKFSLIGSYQ